MITLMKELKASWLEASRKNALDIFNHALPPAKTVETWRRVNFGAWRLTELNAPHPALPQRERVKSPSPAERERVGVRASESLTATSLDDVAGAFRQDVDGASTSIALDPELSRKGVLLLSLEEAAASHPKLVEPHLKELIGSPEFRIMESANLAFFRGGAFLYVPAGLAIEKPIDISFSQPSTADFSFPRVLVVADKGSSVTVVEGYHEQEGAAARASSVAYSRLIVGAQATVRYFYSQELGLSSAHFWHQQVDLGEQAKLRHHSLLLGSAVHKSELDVRLSGIGGRSEIFGVVLGGKNQIFDPHTAQWHQAPRTESDLLFRTALLDRARSIYTGLIRIEKSAVGSEAFQQNNNLLLSNEARADTTPVLEILTDEVRCKHGATVGPVNPEELFYLCSRGLDPKEAEKILILGFLDPIVGKLPLERMRSRVSESIESRLSDGRP